MSQYREDKAKIAFEIVRQGGTLREGSDAIGVSIATLKGWMKQREFSVTTLRREPDLSRVDFAPRSAGGVRAMPNKRQGLDVRTTKRPCIRCNKSFDSESRFNRLCGPCGSFARGAMV